MTEPRLDFGALLPGVGVFGGVRRFLELGNALVRRGHRYVLYHPTGEAPAWLAFGGECRPLKALRQAEHQILLCGEPSLLPDFEAARARVKFFYCVLEKLPEERSIVRHAEWTVLVNSSGLGQRLWKKHRVHAHEIVGGVNLEQFRPVGPPRPAQPEPLRILAYGRLSRRRKGTALVIRAAERLARRLSGRFPAWGGTLAHPVKLVLFDHVGAGNEADPRSQLRTDLPVEFHLNLEQDQLASLYSGCDLFVSAERRAGWNNTVAEAMACGVPVVCTRSGTGDLAQHLETAWVVRVRHPWWIEAGLRALVRQPRLRESLRTNALRQMRDFAWERLAEDLETLARRRLEAGGEPRRDQSTSVVSNS